MNQSPVEAAERSLSHEEQIWFSAFSHRRTVYSGERFRLRVQSTPAQAQGITGPLPRYVVLAGTGVGVSRTGLMSSSVLAVHEFNRVFSWGVPVVGLDEPESASAHTGNGLRQIVSAVSYVASAKPSPPSLTGDLVQDVRAVTNLTSAELAAVLGTSESEFRRWRSGDGTLPAEAERTLKALRAIASMLVGGLGPSGVRRWLVAEPDAPIDDLRRGQVDEVVRRAEAYGETLAT
jgi:DNA-binding transcriptional regulator YiaG